MRLVYFGNGTASGHPEDLIHIVNTCHFRYKGRGNNKTGTEVMEFYRIRPAENSPNTQNKAFKSSCISGQLPEYIKGILPPVGKFKKAQSRFITGLKHLLAHFRAIMVKNRDQAGAFNFLKDLGVGIFLHDG